MDPDAHHSVASWRSASHDAWILGASCLAALVYYGFSFLSDGFLQHDEAAHYLSMRGFWSDPASVLGNWAKPGYKLVYAIPSLLGPQAVVAVNCAIAGATCFFAGRLAREVGSRFVLLAIAIIALQPMWFQLAARTNSETLVALGLVYAVYSHYRGDHVRVALSLSFISTIRQELLLFLSWHTAPSCSTDGTSRRWHHWPFSRSRNTSGDGS